MNGEREFLPQHDRTGQLKENAIPKIITDDNTGPRHLAFHPNLDIFYFDNEQAFHFDRKTGRLTPFQTLSTLPDDFDQRNSCAHLELTPSGKFLYVANRSHDSLAGYLVDQKTGKLNRVHVLF